MTSRATRRILAAAQALEEYARHTVEMADEAGEDLIYDRGTNLLTSVGVMVADMNDLSGVLG